MVAICKGKREVMAVGRFVYNIIIKYNIYTHIICIKYVGGARAFVMTRVPDRCNCIGVVREAAGEGVQNCFKVNICII